MSVELKHIKKIYGEEMAHLCRELFPTILEKEGTLLKILQDHLAPTRSFASDIKRKHLEDEFKDWIYHYYNNKKNELVNTDKTPFELMDEAGYNLYECHNEEDIQSFKKYYANKEVLCTIYMGGRLERCHVFFAVKKNVDEIKREDFPDPQREDEYGTSVISIQFAKGRKNFLSIKNRYNHIVDNPDATFNNNLDNIIPGLTKSFEKQYGLVVYQEDLFDLWSLFSELVSLYVKDNSGKYYRFNVEVNGIYYCENNIIIADGEVIHEYADAKARYLVIDNYIVDRKDKKIFVHSVEKEYKSNDAFTDSINSVGVIKSIDVTKNGDNKIITIRYEKEKDEDHNKEVKIEIDSNNNIIGYENNYIKEIGSYFLCYNTTLKSIVLNNVEKINNYFLQSNKITNNVSLNKVKKIGKGFMECNIVLRNISLPELEVMEKGFLDSNIELEEIYVPKVTKIEKYVLKKNQSLKEISLPELIEIEDYFLEDNRQKDFRIEMPKVKKIGDSFLASVKSIREGILITPELEILGDNFFYSVEEMEIIKMPKLKKLGIYFFKNCLRLSVLEIPEVEYLDGSFLNDNRELGIVSLPNVKNLGCGFLSHNRVIKKFYAPKLTRIDFSEHILPNNTLARSALMEQVSINNYRRNI